MVHGTCRHSAALATIPLISALFIARAAHVHAQPKVPPHDAQDEEEQQDAAPAEEELTEEELGEEELSEEELAEIEAALAGDRQGEPSPPPRSGDPPNSGGVLATAADLLPNIGVTFDMAIAYFSDDDPLQTGGHDPDTSGFNLQQLELALDKSVDPYFRFDSAILFALDGVELEEAYATTLSLPWSFQLRAGQYLTKFGRINARHLHQWTFADQPFVWGDVFGPDGQRGLGVELSYLTPLPWYVELSASAIVSFGHAHEDEHEEAEATESESAGAAAFGRRVVPTAALKQFFELGDNWSLLWGLSGTTGPDPDNTEGVRADVVGSDIYLKYRPIDRASYTQVALQAEWLLRRRRHDGLAAVDTGGYAQLAWRFAQRWGTEARYEYGSRIFGDEGPAVPETHGEATGEHEAEQDVRLSEPRHRVSVGVSWWPSEFSRLRLQHALDVPQWRPLPIYSAFLTLEVSIGAHAAHAF